MRKRQPYLPEFMPGGPGNPLGARALYLGSTLYRIHGTVEESHHRFSGVQRVHPDAQSGCHGSVYPRQIGTTVHVEL